MTTADTTVRRRLLRTADLRWPEVSQPSTLRAHTLPLLMSLALIVAGWAAVAFSRTTYMLEGQITGAHEIPYLLKPGFALQVQTASGRRIALWLDGRCEPAVAPAWGCHKAEFPVGSQVRARASDFVRPRHCGQGPQVFDQLNCLPVLRGRLNSMQRIMSIDVDGERVNSGWSAQSLWMFPYLWVLAFAGVLAWYRWRFADMPVLTVCLLASAFLPFALAVGGGIWNHLH